MITEILPANTLSDYEWRNVQTIAREAFGGQLNRTRTQAEIDHLVSWDDPGLYHQAHAKPNKLVGKSLDPNQTFTKPRVALAYDGYDLIGFGYAVNNVSGTSRAERMVKMAGLRERYLWLSEVAVHPDYQRRDIASDLGGMLLASADTRQPVSANIWPDEIPFMRAKLRRLGFRPTGEQEVAVFGQQFDAVRQVRMQAPRAINVVRELCKNLPT